MTTLRMAAAISMAAAATASGQNLFANSGFEDPITMDGPPFVGSWEGFVSGAPATGVGNDSISPRSGAQHLNMNIGGDDNSFAGAFQDVDGLSAGQIVTFGGYHAMGSSVLDVGVEFRIEWRDSVNDVEISRTPNSTTAPSGSDYEWFSLVGEVPAGADIARCVYAIQTFGGDGPTNSGAIYLDDMSFTIPAPGSVAALGSLGLVMARRRR